MQLTIQKQNNFKCTAPSRAAVLLPCACGAPSAGRVGTQPQKDEIIHPNLPCRAV
jgi:hypothetical protein